MKTSELEKLWQHATISESATMKAMLEAEKLNAQIPYIPDTVGDLVRRMQEEEEARRDRLLLSGLPKYATECYADRFSGLGSTITAFQLRDEDFLQRELVGTSGISDYVINRFGNVGSVGEALRLQNERFREDLLRGTVMEQAKELALNAQQYHLDDYLDSFRTSVGALTDKMLYLDSLDSIRSAEKLKAFVFASTVSDILENSIGYDDQVQKALASFTIQAVPHFDTIKDYGRMLSAAGLSLPHWPHRRLLTFGERRQRLRQRINANAKPNKHARKALDVVQRYELTLREMIDEAMTQVYGEDWAHERLPKCGCKDLYGRWKNKNRSALYDADYHHYVRIMSDPEHFELVFSVGFDDNDAMQTLIKKAGKLRSAAAHFHDFTQEDLRDLRVTWRAIEAGLLGLVESVEFNYH